ncbi:hypothetical protein ES703_27379 [subsurface metagenome]
MKYIWTSITGKGSVNRGNQLIEYCLQRILNLPEPALIVDIFGEKFPEDSDNFDFIINPGSTTLHPDSGNCGAFEALKTKIPVICFGGSVWVTEKMNEKKLIQIATKMHLPVGCRDPFMCNLLRRNSIEAELIGCPTLIHDEKNLRGNYIAFSFGRGNLQIQRDLAIWLSNLRPVKILLHEEYERSCCSEIRAEIISDPREFLKIYANADCVITGRLHGALPSMAIRKPTFFFQAKKHFDSRLTILDYLQLPIREPSAIRSLDFSQLEYNFEKILQLKKAFTSYAGKFHENFCTQ